MLKGKTGAHRSSFNIELSFDKSALKRKKSNMCAPFLFGIGEIKSETSWCMSDVF